MLQVSLLMRTLFIKNSPQKHYGCPKWRTKYVTRVKILVVLAEHFKLLSYSCIFMWATLESAQKYPVYWLDIQSIASMGLLPQSTDPHRFSRPYAYSYIGTW